MSTTARGVPLVRVLVDRAALDTTEHGVLERGATVLALVLTLGRIALGEEIRSREELLVDILVGASRDPHTIRQRAERSGMRWRGPKTVLVVRGPDHQRRAVRAAATRWIGAGDVVADHLQSIVVLVGGDQPGRAAQALAAHLETAGYPVVVGGAGPGATPEELRTRYDEAFRCAQLLAALGRSGGAQMSDLGIFGVLGVPEAAGRAVDFVERTLAPLLEYDAAHDGRLVATLATYLAAGRSRSQAAAELHVHVNTIGSRLTRIGALLGDDWSSVERGLGLQMALQLLPLLRQPA